MKLFCRRFGEGFPLIILHGLFGISDNWVSIARELGEQYGVYVPDLRNHGQSPHSPLFNYDVIEQDLMELTEEFRLENFFLLGHSLGGKAAMHFAIHHPSGISKLVVADIGIRKSASNREHQLLIDAMMKVDFRTAASRADADRQLSKYVESVKLRQFLLKNIYWRDRKTLDWRLDLKSINENLLNVFEAVPPDGQYEGPVLFIRGGRSDYLHENDLELLRQLFPIAIMQTIPNAGHWIHADAPLGFLKMVREFLGTKKPDTDDFSIRVS